MAEIEDNRMAEMVEMVEVDIEEMVHPEDKVVIDGVVDVEQDVVVDDMLIF